MSQTILWINANRENFDYDYNSIKSYIYEEGSKIFYFNNITDATLFCLENPNVVVNKIITNCSWINQDNQNNQDNQDNKDNLWNTHIAKLRNMSGISNAPILVYTSLEKYELYKNKNDDANKVWVAYKLVKLANFIGMKDISQDKFIGAIMGLIICDALGTTYEFSPKGSVNFSSNMEGKGPFNLEAGVFTDDSQMALCMMKSILEKRTIDFNDIMIKFVKWYQKGYMSPLGYCFDIGGTTRNALSSYHTQPEEEKNPFAGDPHNVRAEANGSIMRLAPVPLFFVNNPVFGIAASGDSSKLTHARPVCIQACRIMGEMIIRAIRGVPKDELRHNLLNINSYDPKLQVIVKKNYKNVNHKTGSLINMSGDIEGQGGVLCTLETVFWALDNSTTFEDGLAMTINMGFDTDTTAAVYGQIAGALYGYSNIPAKWSECLAPQICNQEQPELNLSWNDVILKWSNELYHLATKTI